MDLTDISIRDVSKLGLVIYGTETQTRTNRVDTDRACDLLVNNLRSKGLPHTAEKVINCNCKNSNGTFINLYRCHERHCPRCEGAEAQHRYQRLKENAELVIQDYPRAGLFELTCRLRDIAVESVREVGGALGQGMRKIVKAVRTYRGNYCQKEVIPSRIIPGKINLHAHAALLIPAKDKPNVYDIQALCKHEFELDVGSVEWKPAEGFGSLSWYVTKAENLTEFNQEEFDALVDQLRNQKMRFWTN